MSFPREKQYNKVLNSKEKIFSMSVAYREGDVKIAKKHSCYGIFYLFRERDRLVLLIETVFSLVKEYNLQK